MRHSSGFVIPIAVLLVFISGCVAQQQNQAGGQATISGTGAPEAGNLGQGGPPISSQIFGGLCSSPQECSDFCTRNFEKCVDYCKSNPSDEGCKNLQTPSGQVQRNGNDGVFRKSINVPECGADNVFFTSRLMDWDKVNILTPLGQMAAGDHVFPAPHQYAYVIDWSNPSDVEVPVFAPADLVLTEIAFRHYNEINGVKDYSDYTLVFSVCKDFELYFHHVRSLKYQPFIDAAEKIRKTCKFSAERNEDYCSSRTSIPVKAGELIFSTGDLKAGVYGLDIGARDYRLAGGLNFSNPARHCGPERLAFWRCYTVCAFDYFSDELKAAAKFSSPYADSLECGNVYLDVNGTLQGYWFPKDVPAESFNSPESSFLYVGPDNLSPDKQAISLGYNVPGVPVGIYRFNPKESGNANRRPSDIVADGSVYCFEADGGQNSASILFQLTSPTSLKIGAAKDGCSGTRLEFGEFAEFAR